MLQFGDLNENGSLENYLLPVGITVRDPTVFKSNYEVKEDKTESKQWIKLMWATGINDGLRYFAKKFLKMHNRCSLQDVKRELHIAHHLSQISTTSGGKKRTYRPFLKIKEVYENAVFVIAIFEERVEGDLSKIRVEDDTLRLIFQRILEIFDLMHESGGIVHGDIKPDNFVMSYEKKPYLIDFGHSYIKTEDLSKKRLGTPKYRSPEVKAFELNMNEDPEGSRVNKMSDFFSLGITLVETIYEPIDNLLQNFDNEYSPELGINSNFFKWNNDAIKHIDSALLDLILRLLEFDVKKRESFCYQLTDHRWFNPGAKETIFDSDYFARAITEKIYHLVIGDVKFTSTLLKATVNFIWIFFYITDEIKRLEKNKAKREEPSSVPVYIVFKKIPEDGGENVEKRGPGRPGTEHHPPKVIWGRHFSDIKTWIKKHFDKGHRTIETMCAKSAKDAELVCEYKKYKLDQDPYNNDNFVVDISQIKCLVVFHKQIVQ